MAFMFFGVLNIINGIFVESLRRTADADHELTMLNQLEFQGSYANKAKLRFAQDADDSGELTLDGLRRCAKSWEIQAFFSVLEIGLSEAVGLFRVIDTERDEKVPIDDFVIGCMRLRAPAKHIDISSLATESRRARELWTRQASLLEQRLQGLEGALYSRQGDCDSRSPKLARQSTVR